MAISCFQTIIIDHARLKAGVDFANKGFDDCYLLAFA